ncbi:MAG: 3-oxoadipate enol-lactonase [Rhodospirillales bacterium]|nr:3-oxoadipate enol-lactonase [Rhodospirillales bacterium]
MASLITANGISMKYSLDGPEGAPTVLFSNSLMSNYTMWDGQVPALGETYRVLRYDTRGHGGSETPPGPYNFDQLAADAIGLLNALGIERAHFIGLSMGGMIGQVLGAKYPERLLSLAICDSSSNMNAKEIWDGRIAMAERDGIAAMVEPTIERWFTPAFVEKGSKDLDKIRDMIRTTSLEGYIANAQAIRDMNLTGILRQITTPTVVIVGEDDPATPLEQSRVIHDNIQGASLVILKDAAHLSNIEQAEKFNAALLGFLAKNS